MGRDSVIGLVIVVMSVLLLVNTINIPMPPIVPLGPAFYPRILLGLLLIMGMILLLSDLLKKTRPQARTEKKTAPESQRGWAQYKRVFWGFLVFGLYILFIPVIGFYSTTAIVLLILQALFGYTERRQLPLFFVVSVVTTVCIYLIFEKYLMVVFPKGRLF